ncbi:hypothetical protein ACTHO0_19425 [Cytobacillus praedii]|uniref:hypothetical protein n=1 Tax=Cytobacillus praedii TaxID=1742358 RepID=UPI003F81DA87
MGAKNKVIAGDYEGKPVQRVIQIVQILNGFGKRIELNKNTVQEYEVIDGSNQKSVVSAVGRAFVGGVILGPVGWFAALSAKSKGTHVIAIEFKDGKKSLLEVDDKIYSTLMKVMF